MDGQSTSERANHTGVCRSRGTFHLNAKKGNSVEGPSTLRGESLKRLLPECRIIFPTARRADCKLRWIKCMLDACRRRSSTGNAARPRSAADLADKISDVSAGRSINSRIEFEQKLPEKLMSPEAYLAPDEKRLLTRFWQSASGFWRGRSAWRAWLLIALMISVVLLQLFVQYRVEFLESRLL